jgi:hypothetical protein
MERRFGFEFKLNQVHCVTPTLSQYTSGKYGGLLSNSTTIEPTKFTRLHISCMRQYIMNACFNVAQLTHALIDTGGDYHLRTSEHDNRPFPDLLIRYSPLSPSCPIRSHIKPSINYSDSQSFHSQIRV